MHALRRVVVAAATTTKTWPSQQQPLQRRLYGSCAALAPTAVRRRSSSNGNSFHYRKARVAPEDAIDPLSKPTNIDKAALHVVAVPIGNLKDFTLRALDVLRDVDYIVTTDRAATRTLLDLVHVPSQGRLVHYSKHNRQATREKIVELLKGGRSMALVTTSGTPCVGDVGAELVQTMHAHGVRVTAVPGASALLSALAVCGVAGSPHESDAHHDDSSSSSTNNNDVRDDDGGDGSSRAHARASPLADALRDGSFYFGNMLPESHGARLRTLRRVVAPATHACVFYELPRRLLMVLQDIAAVLPQRRVYIAHELTRMNESLHVDTAERLVAYYLRHEAHMLLQRGQLVLVIAGAGARETAAWLEREAARRRRLRRSLHELCAPRTYAPPTSSQQQATTTTATSRKARRQRRRRDRLIAAIEREQARLRLTLCANAADARGDAA